jgi:hypothetical protein
VSSDHRQHEDAGTFFPPEREVITLDHEFHGVAQRREFLDPQTGPADETHLQESLTDLTLGLHPDHLPLIPGMEKT